METAELKEIVRRLRAQGSDDAYVEAKGAAGGLPKDVWPTVSAFANARGGTIILGLSERDGFRPATGFDPGVILDALSEGLTQAPRQTAAKVTPIPDVDVEQMEFEGAMVLVVRVHPLTGSPGPCYVTDQGLERGSYRRWDDQDRRMSSYQIFMVRHRHDYLQTDRQPVESSTDADLDASLTNTMVARLRAAGSRALVGTSDRPGELRRLNVVQASGTPTLSGLVALGAYPQQFFPQLFVDVAVHPGIEKSDPHADYRFVDREICEGPIPVMVRDAVAAVMRNLRTARVVDGIGGRDVPEIPEPVLREAIVNALTHRDYGEVGRREQVAVDVYPDRVEVTNPGGFWGGVTADNVDEGHSRSRNDTLAKMLTNVPLVGREGTVSENQGSGVRAMIGAMRAHGLPAPEFEDRLDAVRVTLHRFGLVTPATREWLHTVGAERLSPHQQIALVVAREAEAVTPQVMRQQVGIDTDDARRLLADLRARGLLAEPSADQFVLAGALQTTLLGLPADAPRLSAGEREVILVFAGGGERSSQEIAAATGRSIGNVRSLLQSLVAARVLMPTAPTTSRARKYVLRNM